MKLVHFFGEKPYGSALLYGHLKNYCSACFKKSVVQCEDCKLVSYCGDACKADDSEFHKFECLAFRNNGSPALEAGDCIVETRIRQVGRLITRQQQDNGVAALCDGFPADVLRNRTFGDLMSHEKEMIKSCSALIEKFLDLFFKFFKGTSLEQTTKKASLHTLCVVLINGFAVPLTGSDAGVTEDGHSCSADTGSLGYVLYLNASRFDHSCAPTLIYGFDGNRMLIDYVDSTDQPDILVNLKNFTAAQIGKLTVSYGYGSSPIYNPAYTLRKKRRASLEKHYFFICQCEICSDVAGKLEEDAALEECTLCHMPYLWRDCMFGFAKLRKICECAVDPPQSGLRAAWENARRLEELKRKWKAFMDVPAKEVYHPKKRESTLALKTEVDSYWHPSKNMRRIQFYEKLFRGMIFENQEIVGDAEEEDKRGAVEFIKNLLIVGESFMKAYEIRLEAYNECLFLYAIDLMGLYGTLIDVDPQYEIDYGGRRDHWAEVAEKMASIRAQMSNAQETQS